MIPFFVFILGLIFGSFINAVVYRLNVGESFVNGRSKCPGCKHVLGLKDLVPLVSWALLKARCRYCRQPISIQYPLVELFTALAFVLVYFASGIGTASDFLLDLQFGAWLISTVFLVIIFVYDFKYYLILDQVVLPAAVIIFILNIFLGVSWWLMLLSGLLAGGFFLLQFVVSRGQWIGGGDIRLGLLMGLMLSWPNILAALFLAYVIGSVVGIGLIATGKKKWGGKVPFGTFLTVATFITMLYGDWIVEWYLNLLYV